MTAEEIRKRILDVVTANGGHLASSLGAVELAMALADVFDPMKDRVVWDVGHQAYAWKILTGRDARIETLRRIDGIAPFPNPAESRADAAVSGHAGSALSVALGFAAARDRKGSGEHVVAVIGDGSIVNGHSFEALNNCAAATEKVIVVLNDNDMAISRPAGSFARLLGRLITGVRYNRVKSAMEKAGHRLHLTFLRGAYHRIESRLKGLFLANRFFEDFGLRYIGPVDGHDLAALKDAFTVAKEDKRSVIVHVVTKKGKGYAPAEQDPTKYHGIGPRAMEGQDRAEDGAKTWSAAFGEALCAAARKDERIVALTAAMTDGTGLASFAKEFPTRFFDVGIAEGHMLGFAAGLAAGGMKPVVAVYSTFLQRAIDQVIHDVATANLPVVICVDRAGVVGADGVTHQGLYDLALLKAIPNLTLCQPKDAADLKALLAEALERNGPTVIRYPRGNCSNLQTFEHSNIQTFEHSNLQTFEPSNIRTFKHSNIQTFEHSNIQTFEHSNLQTFEHSNIRTFKPSNIQTFEHSNIAIWATGDQLEKAYSVAARIPGAEVVFARYLKPFDAKLLAEQRAAGLSIVSLENGAVTGGFGESIGADLRFGWPDVFIPHGSPAELERRYGLDEETLVARIRARFPSPDNPQQEGGR